MIADRIKLLREENGLTQAALAKKLGIKRASVNAWEMGLNLPTTKNLMKLAKFFQVSVDCVLCMPKSAFIEVSSLSEDDIKVIYSLILHMKSKNNLISDK